MDCAQADGAGGHVRSGSLTKQDFPIDADGAQECIVMANDDQCAVIAQEPLLNSGDAVEIEMVGRLVQHQQRWQRRTAQHAGQTRSQQLAAAEAPSAL